MTRRIWSLAVVLAALLPLGARPATAAATPPALAGDTVLAVSAKAVRQTVRVPRDVRLPGSCFPAPELTVSGGADTVQLTLVPQPYRVGDVAVVFGRLPAAAGRQTYDTLCGSRLLKAGTYTLTGVASGPARIRLRLPGLPGRLTLRPSGRPRASVAVLPRIPGAADGTVATAQWAAMGRLDGPGITVVTGWFQQTSSAQVFGDCVVEAAEGDRPDPVTYAPGCPGGRSSVVYTLRSDGTTYFTNQLANIPAGGYGLGAWYLSPGGTLRAGGAVGLWLPF